MNRSEKVLREVLTNQEEIDEFLKQETLEEIYEFVLKKDNSITKKEFDSCIAEIIEKYLAIEKASAVEKGRIEEKDMDMIAGGKDVLSKSMASVLSTLMLTIGVNIPVNATNGEETNKTGIKSSIMEKVNYVIEKIGDAKRFVVKKGEEGFEKTSKILKEHPWIKPVLCIVIVLAVGSGTVFVINKHKEKEIAEKEIEEKEREERNAISGAMEELRKNREYDNMTWKEKYELMSRENSNITKEGFCSYMGVDPSVLTEEGEKGEKKLFKVLNEISEEETEEFWKEKGTWREMYEFVLKKDNSITEEEFCSYMDVDPSVLTEEGEKKEKEKNAIDRILWEMSREEEKEYWDGKTWEDRYKFVSEKDNSITEEGFYSRMGVDPSELTKE